jgi:hypothetical protein
MPHYGNLEKTHNKSELAISNLKGWKDVIIEMGNIDDNGVIQTHWKIKGTAHVFTIPLNQLNKFDSRIDHFKIALETFRDDYIQWGKGGFTEKWMREYHYIFENFIIT